MKITYTEKTKLGCLLLFSDDVKYLFGNETVNAFNAQKGAEVDRELMLKHNASFAYSASLKYALDSLTKSDKTVSELTKKLKAKFFQPDAIKTVTDKLIAANLLNDARYCENYISLSIEAGKGKNAVRTKLLAKGIDRELSERLLSEISPETEQKNLFELLNKQNSLLKNIPPKIRKEKILSKAVVAGFRMSEANKVITELLSAENNLSEADEEAAETDYLSYYAPRIKKRLNALIRKYGAEEATKRVYSEFRQKGAEKEIIEEVIKEYTNENAE